MGGAGIRKGFIEWFMADVFCVGLTNKEVVESQASERLQIPPCSLLQSGRKVASLPAGFDIQSTVEKGNCGVSGGMPENKAECQFDHVCLCIACKSNKKHLIGVQTI